MPATLRRMIKGLQALGRVRVMCVPDSPDFAAAPTGAALVAPGSWCVDAPLWGNVYAPAPVAPLDGARGLQLLPRGRLTGAMNGGGMVRSLLLSVGDALRAFRAITPIARGSHPYTGPWADAGSELVDLQGFFAALPPGWLVAAAPLVPTTPSRLEQYLRTDGSRPFSRNPSPRELEVECRLVFGLGWRLGRTPVLVSNLSVQQATALQLKPLVELRAQYRADFVDAVVPPAVRGNPPAVALCCKAVATAQRVLWKLRWDNAFKEVYWRLVLNGLATAGRMHVPESTCVCVALWLVGSPLVAVIISGTARLLRLLSVFCSSSWQAGFLTHCSRSMCCAWCARWLWGLRVRQPYTRVCGGLCVLPPSMLWMRVGWQPTSLMFSVVRSSRQQLMLLGWTPRWCQLVSSSFQRCCSQLPSPLLSNNIGTESGSSSSCSSSNGSKSSNRLLPLAL